MALIGVLVQLNVRLLLFLGMTTLPTEALHDVPLRVPFWPSRRGL